MLLGVKEMRKKLIFKTLVFGVIIILIGTNVVASTNIKKSNDTSTYIDSDEEIIKNYNNQDDERGGHFYFFVDITITVYKRIFSNYRIFDIQGREFVPYFNAIRTGSSSGDPVVDITIKKISGKTLDFTLSNRIFIFATMLNDVNTDLPKFGYATEGYFDGHALFITF